MSDYGQSVLCPECGRGRDRYDEFCGSCGAALPVLPPDTSLPVGPSAPVAVGAALPGLGAVTAAARRTRQLVIIAALVAGITLELALLVWLLMAR